MSHFSDVRPHFPGVPKNNTLQVGGQGDYTIAISSLQTLCDCLDGGDSIACNIWDCAFALTSTRFLNTSAMDGQIIWILSTNTTSGWAKRVERASPAPLSSNHGFDIPDRIIEDAHLWYFTAMVLPDIDPNVSWQWQNPISVYASGKIVGCGVLFVEDRQLYAECAVDYAIPERLDVESGTKIWCLPKVSVFPATLATRHQHTVVDFERLELRNACTNSDHEPIRSNE